MISPVRINSAMRRDVLSNTTHSKVTPELVLTVFSVGLEAANKILANTTQKKIKQAVHPVTRRYKIDKSQ